MISNSEYREYVIAVTFDNTHWRRPSKQYHYRLTAPLTHGLKAGNKCMVNSPISGPNAIVSVVCVYTRNQFLGDWTKLKPITHYLSITSTPTGRWVACDDGVAMIGLHGSPVVSPIMAKWGLNVDMRKEMKSLRDILSAMELLPNKLKTRSYKLLTSNVQAHILMLENRIDRTTTFSRQITEIEWAMIQTRRLREPTGPEFREAEDAYKFASEDIYGWGAQGK